MHMQMNNIENLSTNTLWLSTLPITCLQKHIWTLEEENGVIVLLRLNQIQ